MIKWSDSYNYSTLSIQTATGRKLMAIIYHENVWNDRYKDEPTLYTFSCNAFDIIYNHCALTATNMEDAKKELIQKILLLCRQEINSINSQLNFYNNVETIIEKGDTI